MQRLALLRVLLLLALTITATATNAFNQRQTESVVGSGASQTDIAAGATHTLKLDSRTQIQPGPPAKIVGTKLKFFASNVTWCTERNELWQASYEAALLELQFDQPLYHVLGPKTLAPLSFCRRVRGEVGSLEAFEKDRPIKADSEPAHLLPITFGLPASTALPIPPFPASQRTFFSSVYSLPICNYEDSALSEWFGAFGFSPSSVRKSSSHSLRLFTLMAYSDAQRVDSADESTDTSSRVRWHLLLPRDFFSRFTLRAAFPQPVLVNNSQTSSRPFLVNTFGSPLAKHHVLTVLPPKSAVPVATVLSCSDYHLRAPPPTAPTSATNGSSPSNESSPSALPNAIAYLDALQDQLRASDAAFVEAETLFKDCMSESIPFAPLVLKPISAPVVMPLIKIFSQATLAHCLEPLGQVVAHDAEEQVPEHVVTMLKETVPYNVSNIVLDSLTNTMVSQLTDSLNEAVDPYLSETVPRAVIPRLTTSLHEILRDAIAINIDRGISRSLSRILLYKLVQSLTRSLPHSLIPGLSACLTPNNVNLERFCRNCYWYRVHCSLCHHSAYSMYYTTYYSAFYSDYYGDYYGDYYAEAVKAVDKAQKYELGSSDINRFPGIKMPAELGDTPPPPGESTGEESGESPGVF